METLTRHNDQVLAFTERIADAEKVDPDERLLLRTIAVLHDCAKADVPLLEHARAGADLAREQLTELGVEPAFVDTVARAILCHMGPLPFIDEEVRKHEKRTGERLEIPKPSTRIEWLFYDADMLTLIDVEGVEKVVTLRANTEQFIDEDRRVAEQSGTSPLAAAYASALRSVRRAADTLWCPTAHRLARKLISISEKHVTDRVGADTSTEARPTRS